MKRIISLWIPVLVWAGLIFYFSSLPASLIKTSDIYIVEFVIKKTAHLVEYTIFYIFLYRAFKNTNKKLQEKALVLSLLILIIYAATDEIHQIFTIGREPRIRDVLIDTIGGLIGLWFLKYKLPKAPEKLKNWAKNLQIL